MSTDASAILALKNAWNGVLAASDRLRELAPAVQEISADSELSADELETYHRATMAEANAIMALRGLLEQIRAKPSEPSSEPS